MLIKLVGPDVRTFQGRPEGMNPSMTRPRNVTGRAARSALLFATLLATAAPAPVWAQAAPAPAPPPSAAPAPAPGMSESVAAVVNDEIISTYDLAQRMRLLIATSGVQPTAENLPQFQQQALYYLTEEKLQFQELRRVEREQKINIIASDAEVNAEIAGSAREANMSPEQYVAQLTSIGVDPRTLRDQLRAQMSWMRWIRGRYGSRLRIGEDQIKAEQERLAAVASKPQYEISEVLIDAARAGGMEAAVQGAGQLAAQLQQGAPFPAVARQFSASATAANGGDAGWVSPGELPPEVDAALEQMRPGQLSRPIPVRDGVYLIYLRDKRAGAGAELVSMKQAAIALPQTATEAQVEAARAKLETVRSANPTCATLEAAVARTDGVVAADLGEASLSDLIPVFREAAETLPVGQLSTPLRTQAGLHAVVVCGKRAAGNSLTRDQIENRLYGQQLTMIARRYLRDLRTSATIETR